MLYPIRSTTPFCFSVNIKLPQHYTYVGKYSSRYISYYECALAFNWYSKSSVKVKSYIFSTVFVQFNQKNIFFRNERINFLLLFVHRYIRLTSFSAVCILYAVSLFRFCGSGPLWLHMTESVVGSRCQQNWWINLLYLQNFYRPTEMVSGVC